jgi:hypothetical protein
MNISKIREEYPQYSDLSDQELADGFHKKFYSDIDKTEFYKSIGFDQPSAPVPTADSSDDERGFLNNAVRGATERASDLLSNFFGAAGTAADALEEKLQLGGFVYDDQGPRYLKSDQFAQFQQENNSDGALNSASESFESFSADYVPRETWQAVKDSYFENGALSASTAGQVLSYGLEQGIKSVPDMVSVMLSLPAYVISRAGEIGEERAINKGKSDAELVEIVEALPAALGSALFERIGAKGIVNAGSEAAEAVGKEALQSGFARVAKEGGKAATKEAATEAFQEGVIEYLGEKLGTGAEMSFAEAGERGLAGALAGGVFGGVAGSAVASGRELTNAMRDNEIAATKDVMEAETLDDAIAAAEEVVDGVPTPEEAIAELEAELNNAGPSIESEFASEPTIESELLDAETQAVVDDVAGANDQTPTAMELAFQQAQSEQRTEEQADVPDTETETSVDAQPDRANAAETGSDSIDSNRFQREEIDRAGNDAATSPNNDLKEPTEAQREAGNFKMGHTKVGGFDITIEFPRGSTRKGKNKEGVEWERTLESDYGYIKRTKGADGENVDVFIGENPESDKVFVVDQVSPDSKEFDEQKVMMGFDTKQSARDGYLANYAEDWQGLGAITEMTQDQFKDWVNNGDLSKPVSDIEGQQEILLSRSGVPFKSERSAKLSQTFKANPEANVVPVDGGFGIAPQRAGGDVEASAVASLRTGGLVRTADVADAQALEVETSPQKIVASMREHFNVPLRKGRLSMRKAAGTHNKKTGVIRQKNMVDLEVFSHELGHALESRFGEKLTALIGANEKEIAPLSYDPLLPKEQLLREGFAEFFRIYVTNPQWAKRNAPQFEKQFSEYMTQVSPQDLAQIQAAQKVYEDYLGASSETAIKGSMSTTDKGNIFRRFQLATKPKALGENLRAWGNDVYTSFINRQHPIYMAVKQLEKIHNSNAKSRLNLKRADDAHVLARLAVDAFSAGQVQLEKGVIAYDGIYPEGPSLQGAIHKALDGNFSQDKVKDFGSYLISRRAIHEWNNYAEGKIRNRPTLQSKKDHENNIATMESENKSFKEAAEDLYTFLEAHWKKKFDAGLITAEQYQEGLDNHKDYVPFMRDRSDLTETGGGGSGGEGTGRNSIMKRFEGSDRDIINPIESIMSDVYQTESMIKTNDARKALADLADVAGYGSGTVIERIPDKEMKQSTYSADQIKSAIKSQVASEGMSDRDAQSLETVLLGIDDLDLTSVHMYKPGEINERGEPIIYVWRNGQREAYRLADGDFGLALYEAITGINKEQVGTLTNLLSVPAQMMRLGITTEPTFQLTNTIRGELTAWALNPDYRPGVDFMKGAKSAAMFDEQKQAYIGAGGMMGGINTSSLSAKRAQKDIEQLSRDGIDIKRVSFRNVLTLSEFSESAMRIGLFRTTFKEAKKRGLSDKQAVIEAAFTARDITDYSMVGSKMMGAQRLVTFLGAALKGIDKFARTIGGSGSYQAALDAYFKGQDQETLSDVDKKNLKAARGVMVWMMSAGLAGAALTALYTDDPEYQEISEYLRATHWMLRVGDRWLAIPKPFQEAILSNIFERAYEAHYHQDPEALGRMQRSVMTTIGPPMVPVILRPGIEHFANKSMYNGMPLISQRLKGLEKDQQYYAWTSSFAKQLGKAAGVSPILIDHYITSWTGTVGRTVLRATTSADENAPADGLEDMMIISRFVRDWTRGAVSNEEFYKKMADDGGKLSAKYATFRNFVLNDENDEAREYLASLSDDEKTFIGAKFYATYHPKSKSQANYHPMVRAEKIVAKLYEVRRNVRESESLESEQKRQLDDAISERIVHEFRNSMIASQQPGYTKRKITALEENLRKISHVSERVAEEILDHEYKYPAFEQVNEDYAILKEDMLGLAQDIIDDDTDIDLDDANPLD